MKKISVVFLITLSLFSCNHAYKVSTPAQDSKKMQDNVTEKDLLAENIETALGETIFTEFLKTHKIKETSKDFENYLAEITAHIGSVSHRTNVKYQTLLIDTKETFAYGLPGGKIVLGAGILKIIKTESELANWISDQIAHIAKQHLIKSLMKNSDYAKALQEGTVSTQVAKQALFTITEMGFGTDDVNEADRLAPTYALHFGYEIQALQTLLENLKQHLSKNGYGETDQNFDMINHRASMNGVFVKALQTVDKTQFPKTKDRFNEMMKKIKPTPQPKKKQ